MRNVDLYSKGGLEQSRQLREQRLPELPEISGLCGQRKIPGWYAGQEAESWGVGRKKMGVLLQPRHGHHRTDESVLSACALFYAGHVLLFDSAAAEHQKAGGLIGNPAET